MSTTTAQKTDALSSAFTAAVRSDSLSLTILPTESCNFRCTYCYEDFLIPRMSPEVVERLKRFLRLRLPELRALNVEWFGGEPLLALPVIRELSAVIQQHVADSNLTYKSGITTNGWHLTRRTAIELISWGVTRAQVSLDGPQALHDTTRKLINGKGSYEQIMGNLLDLRASDIPLELMLRVHLTPDNRDLMPAYIEELQAVFLDDARFSLLLTRVGHLGGPNDHDFAVLGEQETSSLISLLRGRLGVAEERTTRSDRIDAGTESEFGVDVCYAAKPNALVVRADGTLAKCTVALKDSTNNIGSIAEDGSLQVDNRLHQAWLKGWFDGDLASLSCPLMSMRRTPTM